MRINVIRLLVQSSSMHAYWVDNTLEGIFSEAARRDQEIEFLDMMQIKNSVPNELRSGCLVLLVGYAISWMSDAATILNDNGYKPIIISAQPPPEFHYMNSVTFQVEEAVRKIIKHLVAAGHRRIALLGCNPDSTADEVKRRVFLESAPVLGSITSSQDVFPSFAALDECTESFLSRFDDYDAVMCSNDTVAIHLIRKLKQNGCLVPRDIFITGMGNSNIGRRQRPSLTSIDFDYFELGKQAVRLFGFLKDNPTMLNAKISLPCRLIIRESTANYQTSCLADLSKPIDHHEVQYYSDPEISEIIRIEEFMQHCDETDREILFGIIADNTYEQISERLNLSDSTVKYRLKKMMARFGAENKGQLIELVKTILPPDEILTEEK